jgi:hypothetical protein
MKMYVDDSMFIGRDDSIDNDLRLVDDISVALLGPGSVAHEKDLKGRCLDWIGYEINLDTRQVSMAEHCFLKAVYYFFSVSVDRRVTLRQLQQLGSMAERYSAICEVMRPYSAAIWACTHGLRSQESTTELSLMGKRSVWFWRCVLCMFQWDRKSFCRTLESFRRVQKADYRFTFDACLTGIGGEIHRYGYDDAGKPVLLRLGVLREAFPFDLGGKSDYQNLSEFIGVLALLLCLVEGGARDCSIFLVGDSTTALKWAGSKKFSGESRNNVATLVYTILCIRFRISVQGTQHVRGEDNGLCDALSRRYPMTEYGLEYEDPSIYFQWGPGDTKSAILELCNPLSPDDGSMGQFLGTWTRVFELVGKWPS